MIAPLRSCHRLMTTLLMVAVPAVLLMALRARTEVPRLPEIPLELATDLPQALAGQGNLAPAATFDGGGITAQTGQVDGVAMDIGVSSMQLDRAERGFSFQADGPLDMRMEQDGESAADFINTADEGMIADTIYAYGEEHRSRRIARAIVAARPIETTGELAAVVRKAVGYHAGAPKDPATRTFQAIRIHLNRELDELRDGLAAAEAVLAPGGRLAVVTFHSLEDRIVKQFLRERSGRMPGGSRHLPEAATDGPSPSFDKPAKPMRASAEERDRNPRSRSATLRSARRSSAPPWPMQKRGAA